MSLYVAAATLALFATVLLGPVSTAMARARWVDRAPRAGVAVWQAIGASALLAGIGSGLCVAVERYHSGVVGGMSQLADGIVGGRPLAMIGLPDALGLTLAADLAFVLCCMLGAVTVNTVPDAPAPPPIGGSAGTPYSGDRSRRSRLLQSRRLLRAGIRPRIVVSAGAIELLDDAELDAVVAHEQGHAHEHHGLVMLPVGRRQQGLRVRAVRAACALLRGRAARDGSRRLRGPPAGPFGTRLRTGLHGDRRRRADLFLRLDRRVGVSAGGATAEGAQEVDRCGRRSERCGPSPVRVAGHRPSG